MFWALMSQEMKTRLRQEAGLGIHAPYREVRAETRRFRVGYDGWREATPLQNQVSYFLIVLPQTLPNSPFTNKISSFIKP